MADFGEYLPIDMHLANCIDAELMHNPCPNLWAGVISVASRGMTGEAHFFMRVSFIGLQQYCSLLWDEDQSVDFSRHDGLVISRRCITEATPRSPHSSPSWGAFDRS